MKTHLNILMTENESNSWPIICRFFVIYVIVFVMCKLFLCVYKKSWTQIFPPFHHHNGFVTINALGHSMYTQFAVIITKRAHCFHDFLHRAHFISTKFERFIFQEPLKATYAALFNLHDSPQIYDPSLLLLYPIRKNK